jgi:hypothetical protein
MVRRNNSIDNSIDSEVRVCLFSHRNIGNLVSRCGHFEFEDVICQVDNVDLISPEPYGFLKSEIGSLDTGNSPLNIWYKCANRVVRYTPVSSINPGIRKIKVKKNYELFLAFFQFPRDILSINAIDGWRERCLVSACWVDDLWKGDLHLWEKQLKMLSNFDYIFLNYYQSIQYVQEMVGRPCVYMAPGIDMIRFCPYPDPPDRVIDIYAMGRKSQIIHRDLLKISEIENKLYLFDTIRRMETANQKEHRNMFANLVKRSRYFLVNIGKYGDSETKGQVEVGFRFFEGAGAGAIMIGDAPDTENFKKEFDWPDVVVTLNNDSNNIGDIIRELDADPTRQKIIRRNNIVQSLLRHDWSYRWKDILKLVGLNPTTALAEREIKLKTLAKLAEN